MSHASGPVLWEMNRALKSQLLPVLIPRCEEIHLFHCFLRIAKFRDGVPPVGYKAGGPSQYRFDSADIFESYVWVLRADMQDVVAVFPIAR